MVRERAAGYSFDMKKSRTRKLAVHATTLGAVLAGFATAAAAQKARPAGGPPVVTQGTVKANPRADKGQETATARRAAAREAYDMQHADATHEEAERSAWKIAKSEPKALLKGINVSKEERAELNLIEKRYKDEFKSLDTEQRAAVKAGKGDANIIARIDVARMRERADLRGRLTPAEQVRFDLNVSNLGRKKS
jgi:hypothetical protein